MVWQLLFRFFPTTVRGKGFFHVSSWSYWLTKSDITWEENDNCINDDDCWLSSLATLHHSRFTGNHTNQTVTSIRLRFLNWFTFSWHWRQNNCGIFILNTINIGLLSLLQQHQQRRYNTNYITAFFSKLTPTSALVRLATASAKYI